MKLKLKKYNKKTSKKYNKKTSKKYNKKTSKKTSKKYNKKGNKKYNKMRLYGGEDAINHYYNNEILTKITQGDIVENLFNPNAAEGWKQVNPISHPYSYIPYNSIAYYHPPIYFGKLPAQNESNLYTPIYMYNETANIPSEPIPQDLLTIYAYIVNTLFQNEWQICLAKSQLCPWSKGLKDRAHRSCSGFNAPAIGVILYFYREYMIRNINISDQEKNIAINTGLNVYSILTGYGKNSPYSWNALCNTPGFFDLELIEGSNIITFYERSAIQSAVKGCKTYHHFIVYKQLKYCIVIDSWAGIGGGRGEWARIMTTSDITTILRQISITTSLEETDQLLNEYFIVPHGIEVDNNIELNKQEQLLGVGSINMNNLDNLNPGLFNKLHDMAKQDLFVDKYGGTKN
jgi:hypothetical protein